MESIEPRHLHSFFAFVHAARHWAQRHPGLAAAPDIRQLLAAYPETVWAGAGQPAAAAPVDALPASVSEAEAARREIAEKYERQSRVFDATLSALTDFVYIFDHEGRFLYANEALLKLWGLPLADAVGKNFFDLRYPDDLAARLQRQIQQVIETGQVVSDETPYTSPTGAGGYYEYIFSPVFAADGTVETVAGSTRDITARKRAEMGLRESEERFRRVFEHAVMGIAITNLEGSIQRCNPAFCALLGYAEEELRQFNFAALVHSDDRAENLAAVRRLQAGKLSYFEIENRYVRKDGSPVWVHKFVSLLRAESGQPTHFLTLVTDVTGRRRTELALKQAKEAAEAANRSKDRFLAVLSHELRTPLTPVLMTAAALHHDESLPAELREQLGMIERNVALEARLIDDLLDLTRIVSGKFGLRAEACDAHALIGLVVEMVRSDAREKQIALHIDLTARGSRLTGDPARLQQVFWNLLRNAVKFTPPGGRVAVRSIDGLAADSTAEARICIEVSDDGIGFEQDVAARIFEPFEQSESGHRFGGLGLGLSIARAIVDMHGGVIRAASPGPGQGAIFTVELPGALAPSSWPTPATPGAPAHSAAPQREAPMRLLLVEDHEPTRQVLTRLLSRAGHRVVVTRTIAEARAAATRERFDAVVSDLGLPDGTGIELMERLRADHALRGIALSGYGADEDMLRSLEAGFAAHLVKPVDINELRRTLRQLGPLEAW